MQIAEDRPFYLRKWSDLGDLDWHLLAPVLILLFFGFLLLKSAGDGSFLSRQVTIFIFSLLLVTLPFFIRINFWKEKALFIYLFNLLLLFLVLIKGASSMGAQRWIDLGFIRLQPSEIAKIAIIISLAAWFSKRPVRNCFDLMIAALIIAPPFLLIFKQPDLGTALAYLAIFFGMSFWAGATTTDLLLGISPVLSLLFNAVGMPLFNLGNIHFRNRIYELYVTQFFFIFLVFLLFWLIINYKPWKSPLLVLWIASLVSSNFIVGFLRPVLWGVLHPYQQRRLTIFLNPENDPQGAGYHIIQSLLAIGNGGIFGYGWQNGRLTRGNYVPAQHTDFVFSVLGEEFGFIGTVFVILVFAYVLWRMIYIARNSNNDFASLIAIGIFSFFSFHIFINIGMTLGIMPITGVPLPFLSYGGTALIVDIFSVFILLSISWKTLPKKLF